MDSEQEATWTPPMLLQVAMIGALLADKRLRAEVDAGDFTFWGNLAGAVAELTTAQKRTGWPCLKRLLADWGVEWDEKEKPLRRMMERLKLDAEVSRVLGRLGSLARQTEHATDEQQRQFLKAIANFTKDSPIDLNR